MVGYVRTEIANIMHLTKEKTRIAKECDFLVHPVQSTDRHSSRISGVLWQADVSFWIWEFKINLLKQCAWHASYIVRRQHTTPIAEFCLSSLDEKTYITRAICASTSRSCHDFLRTKAATVFSAS